MERDAFIADVLAQPVVLAGLIEEETNRKILQEIYEAMAATASRQANPVIFTGMGSSYYAALPAVMHLNRHGIPALAFPSSTLLHYQRNLISWARLLIVISQSGESIEVVRLLEEVERAAPIVGVTNEPGSSLARLSHYRLLLGAGTEATVSSKTYTASVLVLLMLADSLVHGSSCSRDVDYHPIVDAVASSLADWRHYMEEAGDFLGVPDYLYLISRGPSLATAGEAALICKELAKLPTGAVEAATFRHGPMEIVDCAFRAVVISHYGLTSTYTLRLAKQIADCGGVVLLVSNMALDSLQHKRIMHVPVAQGLDEYLAPVADIIPLQLLAAQIAGQRGFRSDQFRYISKVTRVE